MKKHASFGDAKDDTVSKRSSRRPGSGPAVLRRGQLVVGMLIGAAFTTCFQSIYWASKESEKESRHKSQVLSALMDSKRRRSQLRQEPRQRDRVSSSLPNSNPLDVTSEGFQKARIIKSPNLDFAAGKFVSLNNSLDDDDLVGKLRSAREAQVNPVPLTPYQQRVAAHRERLREIREKQKLLQQLEPRRVEKLEHNGGGAAISQRTQRPVLPKKPRRYDERRRKSMPRPTNATLIDWSFQAIDKMQGDPFGIAEFCDPATRTFHSLGSFKYVCIQGSMPNYTHPPPNFLSRADEEIFLLQPENLVAMRDDWVDWSFQTCVKFPTEAPQNIVMKVDTGGIQSFQHFHDNALGLIYQARQAMNLIQSGSTCNQLTEHLDHKTSKHAIIAEEWKLMGFSPAKAESSKPGPNSIEVEITFFPQDFDQVRVHPLHVDYLRRNMPKQTSINSKKVVYVSRQGSNKGPFGRQLLNETDFEVQLMRRIPGFMKYTPGKDPSGTMAQVFERIGDACLILGLHGGHMYNQYFTGPKTAVLEIMPVANGGLFHDQANADQRPHLAHRAIWHNANLIRQPYWRMHLVSSTPTNFAFDDFSLDKIAQIVKAAGCITR